MRLITIKGHVILPSTAIYSRYVMSEILKFLHSWRVRDKQTDRGRTDAEAVSEQKLVAEIQTETEIETEKETEKKTEKETETDSGGEGRRDRGAEGGREVRREGDGRR